MKDKLGTCKKTYMALERSFWYGMAAATGMHMFVQDYLGLEGYITWVRRYWTELHWGFGLVLAAAGLTLYGGLLNRYSWLNTDDSKEKEHEG